MIHSSDLLSISLTAIGNKILTQKNVSESELKEFSSFLNVGLVENNPDLDGLIIHTNSKNDILFSDWLKNILNENYDKFVAFPKLKITDNNIKKNSEQFLNERILHAFEGSNVIAIGILKKNKIDIFFPKIYIPPKFKLKAEHIIKFVESHTEKEKIKEQLLWQNKYNLNYYNGDDWEGFVQSFTDEKVDDLMQIWEFCFPGGESDFSVLGDWDRYVEQYLNEDRQIKYIINYINSFDKSDFKFDFNFETQKINMKNILSNLSSYAEEKNDKIWSNHFNSVIEILNNNNIKQNVFIDIFKKCGLSDDALGLLESGLRSDVFGGMGSWNDVSYMQEQKYNELSEQLFSELFNSICIAVNSI